MNALKIFVLDDNVVFCDLIADLLSKQSCLSYSAHSLSKGKSILHENKYDLYLLDLHLPDGNGSDLIKQIKDSNPNAIIVIITSKKPSLEFLNSMLSRGVSDYILKTEVEHRLNIAIERVKERKRFAKGDFPDFSMQAMNIGKSQSTDLLKKHIKSFSNGSMNILIYGETGSGKEIAARAFNSFHPDRSRPFVAVNLAAVPDNLIEDELFGHVKGAFTNADSDKIGKFELADGGDLFIDEVGEIPIHIQPKLLRVVQSGQFCRLGSNKTIEVKIRIISATNRDLHSMIEEGTFRQDLYFRLAAVETLVPPLRERVDDIPELAKFILKKFNYEHLKLSNDALSYLISQPWTGNIRELEQRLHVAAHIVTVSKENLTIEREDLTPNIILNFSTSKKKKISTTYRFSKEGYRSLLFETERDYIKSLLESVQHDVTLASKKIGIGRSVMYTKIDKLGLGKSNEPQ